MSRLASSLFELLTIFPCVEKRQHNFLNFSLNVPNFSQFQPKFSRVCQKLLHWNFSLFVETFDKLQKIWVSNWEKNEKTWKN